MNQDTSGAVRPVSRFSMVSLRISLSTYARFALKLYENGSAKIGDILIEPSNGCRNYSPPSSDEPSRLAHGG